VLLSAKSFCVHLAAIIGTTSLAAAENPQAAPSVVLDVPYVGQTEALCGGAALAMIFRYWGRTGVYSEDFAALVEEDEGGIRTSVLAAEVRRRGWQAIDFSGSASAVQRLLREGRPLLALIEDRPGRYHYVVLTGWVGDLVLFHDPLGAPFR
jgi:ABC-type bacteriocin/lantibiotic exporter with double-glycine peptidase domain